MNIILMILLLSILILVHEAGHFLAAKFFKMKVDKFGFGLPIGPTLFKKKFNDTEFLLHAFLLGGYVSFPDDDENSDLPKDSDQRFQNKPIYQRSIVIASGVVANVICAYFLVVLAAGIWGKLPNGSYNVYFSKLHPEINKSIEYSGIKTGDKLLKINGSEVKYPYELNIYAQNSKDFDGKTNKILVNKNIEKLKSLNKISDENTSIERNKIIKLPKVESEEPVELNKNQKIGLAPYFSKNTVNLNEKQIKLRDLLKNKKEITSDGTFSLHDIATAISDNVVPLELVVLRDGKEITLKNIKVNEKGLLGVEKKLEEKFDKTTNPIQIIKKTNDYLISNTSLMINGLGKIVTGKIPLDDMHGVIAITKIGGEIIEHQGLFKGLLLTAVISLNLAIINILPIPALDGGHLLFLLIEKIKGKPVDEKVIMKISNIFFNILIIFMILIIFNDIIGIVTNKI